MNPLFTASAVVSALGILSSAGLGWAYLKARDTIEHERGKLAQVEAALSERIIRHDADNRNNNILFAELARQTEREREAVRESRVTERAAVALAAQQEKTIARLELEADIDEIPDSNACLNVYVPFSAVSMLHPGNCDRGDTGTGAGETGTCSLRPHPADPAFANITIGDALILWGRDRAVIEMHNSDKRQIRALSEKAVP